MNHFDPERIGWDGRREIASHETPLIGPYDSGDDHALECQVLLMKLAGIDGVIIDWYGTGELFDHAANHRHTERLVTWIKRARLKFAVCYEDQAVKTLPAGADVAQAERDLAWAERHWFGDPAYVRHDGRPVLLVFGPQHLSWNFALASKPLVYGLPHLAKPHHLEGIFAWPPVTGGKVSTPEVWRKELGLIYGREEALIATAFPGFKDIYRQAGLHDSYGSIDARGGKTFVESLELAIESRAPIIQLATWNDYGEGTVLEPTRSNGYRYLEHIQRLRRAGNLADLRLPVVLYQSRKRGGDAAVLDQAAERLFAGQGVEAEALLARVGRELAQQPIDGAYRLVTEVLYREEAGITPYEQQRCRLDLYLPAEKRAFATVVWFHGGGLTQGERSIPEPLRQQGFAVVAANYRLSPGVKSPAYIEDAAAAIAWTLKHIGGYGGDPRKVFVSGHSAGAYLALMAGLDKRWLAARDVDADQLAGLIPLSPQAITHFTIRQERGLGDKQPLIDEFAPLYHVRKDAPPMLLVTGDRDKELLGRYEENAYFRRMLQEVGHPDARLHELEGFDHGNMPEPAFPLLRKFVAERSNP
jgi:acetyl esterase/lipase